MVDNLPERENEKEISPAEPPESNSDLSLRLSTLPTAESFEEILEKHFERYATEVIAPLAVKLQEVDREALVFASGSSQAVRLGGPRLSLNSDFDLFIIAPSLFDSSKYIGFLGHLKRKTEEFCESIGRRPVFFTSRVEESLFVQSKHEMVKSSSEPFRQPTEVMPPFPVHFLYYPDLGALFERESIPRDFCSRILTEAKFFGRKPESLLPLQVRNWAELDPLVAKELWNFERTIATFVFNAQNLEDPSINNHIRAEIKERLRNLPRFFEARSSIFGPNYVVPYHIKPGQSAELLGLELLPDGLSSRFDRNRERLVRGGDDHSSLTTPQLFTLALSASDLLFLKVRNLRQIEFNEKDWSRLVTTKQFDGTHFHMERGSSRNIFGASLSESKAHAAREPNSAEAWYEVCESHILLTAYVGPQNWEKAKEAKHKAEQAIQAYPEQNLTPQNARRQNMHSLLAEDMPPTKAIKILAEFYRDELDLFRAIDAYSTLIENSKGEEQNEYRHQRCRLNLAVGYNARAQDDLVALGYPGKEYVYENFLQHTLDRLRTDHDDELIKSLNLRLSKTALALDHSHPMRFLYLANLANRAIEYTAITKSKSSEICDLAFASISILRSEREMDLLGYGSSGSRTESLDHRLGLRFMPNNPYALRSLFEACISYLDDCFPPRWNRSLDAGRAAYGIAPTNGFVADNIGELLGRRGFHNEAKEILLSCADKPGHISDLGTEHTIPYLVEHHGPEVGSQYAHHISRHIESVPSESVISHPLETLVRSLLRNYYFENARNVCEELLQSYSKLDSYILHETRIMAALAQVQLKSSKASVLIDELEALDPTKPEIMLLKALYEFQHGRKAEALGMFKIFNDRQSPFNREHINEVVKNFANLAHTKLLIENGRLDVARTMLKDYEIYPDSTTMGIEGAELLATLSKDVQ